MSTTSSPTPNRCSRQSAEFEVGWPRRAVEFRAEDPNVPIKELHKMSKKQIVKEFEPNGFRLVEEFDKLPWQHLMFFGRDNELPKR